MLFSETILGYQLINRLCRELNCVFSIDAMKFEWDFCFEIGLNGHIKANWAFPWDEHSMTAVLRSECSRRGKPGSLLSSTLEVFLHFISSVSFHLSISSQQVFVNEPGSQEASLSQK